MFYVSHIDGAQTPYMEEVYRVMRRQAASHASSQASVQATAQATAQVEVQSATQAEANAEAQAAEGASFDDSGNVIQSTPEDAGRVRYQPASAAVTGMASATVMKGVQMSGGASEERIEIEQEPKPRNLALQAAAHIRENKQEKVRKKKNPYDALDKEQPKREKALLAKQIMTAPVLTIERNSSVSEAGKIFEEKRFRHIPVVDEGGQLVGIFSDRDYLRASDKEDKVDSYMAHYVLTARPDTEIRLIANILFKERIGSMPIVDDEGCLVGMLTRSDILCAVVNHAPLELWA